MNFPVSNDFWTILFKIGPSILCLYEKSYASLSCSTIWNSPIIIDSSPHASLNRCFDTLYDPVCFIKYGDKLSLKFLNSESSLTMLWINLFSFPIWFSNSKYISVLLHVDISINPSTPTFFFKRLWKTIFCASSR